MYVPACLLVYSSRYRLFWTLSLSLSPSGINPRERACLSGTNPTLQLRILITYLLTIKISARTLFLSLSSTSWPFPEAAAPSPVIASSLPPCVWRIAPASLYCLNIQKVFVWTTNSRFASKHGKYFAPDAADPIPDRLNICDCCRLRRPCAVIAVGALVRQ